MNSWTLSYEKKVFARLLSSLKYWNFEIAPIYHKFRNFYSCYLLFQNVEEWSFDVFEINDIGEGHALKYVSYELLQKYDLITKFKVSLS